MRVLPAGTGPASLMGRIGYGLASYTMLISVSLARRKRVRPALVTTSRIRASRAWRRARARRPATAMRGAQQGREAVQGPSERVEVVLHPVAGHRLDDHPGAVGRQGLADVPGGADGIAHVVEAVEHGDEVISAARERVGRRDLEPDPVAHACLGCPLPRGRDRALVIVGADERGGGEGLGHQDRRRAVAAADVRHRRAAFEQGRVACGKDSGQKLTDLSVFPVFTAGQYCLK